jgi:hypothetical protein
VHLRSTCSAFKGAQNKKPTPFSNSETSIYWNSVTFRILELFPLGIPKVTRQIVGDAEAVTHFSKGFRDSILQEDAFRSAAIRVGNLAPVFVHLQRIGQTAAFATWTRYQPTDTIETLRRGFDAFTLLLSGVSECADKQVIEMFSKLVLTPPLKTPQFTTQEYGIAPQFVDRIRTEARPVGMNIYLRPNVVNETGIASAAAAMTGAFFGLLGADRENSI